MGENYVPPGLVEMAEPECWELVAAAATGRIAMAHEERIWIIPVDHVLDGTAVVFRVPEGSPVDVAAGWGRPVAFQVDRVGGDLPHGETWTVLVQGELREAGQDDTHRLRAVTSQWARGDRSVIARIVAEHIGGRRVPQIHPA